MHAIHSLFWIPHPASTASPRVVLNGSRFLLSGMAGSGLAHGWKLIHNNMYDRCFKIHIIYECCCSDKYNLKQDIPNVNIIPNLIQDPSWANTWYMIMYSVLFTVNQTEGILGIKYEIKFIRQGCCHEIINNTLQEMGFSVASAYAGHCNGTVQSWSI